MRTEGEGIITVSVDGSRTEPQVWEAVRALPKDQLPPLTPAQREVAASLHIPEKDYARSVEAARRTTDELLKKAERFARVLNERIRTRNQEIQVERVALNTLEQRFEILLRVNGEVETLRVAERVVDGLFEDGSREAEENLSRILDYALVSGARG
jgi:hypothetical protein